MSRQSQSAAGVLDSYALAQVIDSSIRVGRRQEHDAITAKARRFGIDKNEVISQMYQRLAGSEADLMAVESLLCRICNAFLADICPEWQQPGAVAESGYIPTGDTAKAVRNDPVEPTKEPTMPLTTSKEPSK